MEMKIRSAFVIAERERRAWSQQHLADAAGLALRTIQRIESGGSASNESVQAIGACLGVSPMDLREAHVSAQPVSSRFRIARLAAAASVTALLLGAIGLFAFNMAHAKQVLVDLGITIEQEVIAENKSSKDVQNFRTQVLLDDGAQQELPMEGKFNLVVSPRILHHDGSVILSMKLYEQRKSGPELVAEPKAVAFDGKETVVAFSVGEGAQRLYRISFKPTLR